MDQYSAWGKTYAIWKLRPSTVYLGSSRVEIGLPVKHAAFGDAVVFNAGLSRVPGHPVRARVVRIALTSGTFVRTSIHGVSSPDARAWRLTAYR